MQAVPQVTNKAEEELWACCIDDEVDALRAHGTMRRLALEGSKPITLGSATDCELQLDDPLGFVSRYHARLVREGRTWNVRDLGSTNGIRIDDDLRTAARLSAGMELEVGSIKLIADSAGIRDLVAYLSRILGWAPERQPDVDRALRAVRDFASRRAVLALCGPGDLSGVARRLHLLAVGERLPLIQFAPEDSITLGAAAGGSCLAVDLPAQRLAELAERVARDQEPSARVVLCFEHREEAAVWAAALSRAATTAAVDPRAVPRVQVIGVPSVTERPGELARMVSEYAADASLAVGAPSSGFREHEMTWLDRLGMQTVGEIEETMLRLVVLRNYGATGGAQRLGISRVALARWIRRRNLPL